MTPPPKEKERDVKGANMPQQSVPGKRIPVVPIVWEKQPIPQRVGLALGGGAARGLAHIGVLEVLEEYRIPIHCIAGTSAGALVGGLCAAGVSATRMRTLAENLNWRTISSLSRPSLHLNARTASVMGLPLGILDLDRLIGWIEQVLGGSLTFDDLSIPFAAIATDIVSGEMIVMNQGPIAPAIRASCSVPGVFTPCRREHRLLVDGGTVNNLPVAVVRQMGADYVISVDLLPAPQEQTREPRNMLEVAMVALYTLIRASQMERPMADCTIAPAIAHIGLADLGAGQELMAAGRAAAEALMPTILQDLQIQR